MNKKNFLAVFIGLILILSACANKPGQEKETQVSSEALDRRTQTSGVKLEVYCSTDPLYDFVKYIGGDRVEVKDLIEGVGDAHHWEPTPDLIIDLNKSDLFFINGAGLEMWLDDIKASIDKDIPIVDCSKGIDLIAADHDDHDEDEDHDHDHDEHEEEHHNHGAFDPHCWTSPICARKQAENVLKALVEADPDGKNIYEENYKKLEERFDKLVSAYKDQLKAFSGKSLILPHMAFSYLCRDFGLKQLGMQGILADGDLNADKLVKIVDLAKKEGIEAVFYDAYGSKDKAEALASEFGGRVLPIYTLEAISKEDRDKGYDYFVLMEKNLENIIESFAR